MSYMSNPRTIASYHNMTLFLIVTLVVALCYPINIDTAVVRPEKQLQQVRQLLLRDSNARIPRAAGDNDEGEAPPLFSKRICHNAPCGWAVYNPNTRIVQYFMKNTCVCLDVSYKCVRVGDDLSASAYVYRCRQNTSPDDIEADETD